MKERYIMKKNEIVLFETEDKAVRLEVPIESETVWLTQEQMSELFDTARSSIAYHIGNIFKEKELDADTSVEIFDRSSNASRPPKYYNLDVIISVGYRVKSKRGVEFRRWANSVLKQYILQGYAVNDKRIAQLGEVTKRQIKQNPSLHCGGFLYYSVIFSCFTLWSMTWREASSALISSRLIPA